MARRTKRSLDGPVNQIKVVKFYCGSRTDLGCVLRNSKDVEQLIVQYYIKYRGLIRVLH